MREAVTCSRFSDNKAQYCSVGHVDGEEGVMKQMRRQCGFVLGRVWRLEMKEGSGLSKCQVSAQGLPRKDKRMKGY